MLNYRGRWGVEVLEKNAAYNQRVLISGADVGNGSHPGTPGSSFVVDGDTWNLMIQHNDGTGWDDSALHPDPIVESGAHLHQKVYSEDRPEDSPSAHDKNDLIINIYKIDPIFDIEYRPSAVNPGAMEMFPDGIFVGLNGVQYMSVKVTNRWGKALHEDTILAISSLGRQTLTAQGISVIDSWSAAELESTGQELSSLGILVGALEVGESRTIFFKVDASGARKGKPEIEFHMLRSSGVPDVGNTMRFNRHRIFIAEVGFDFSTKEAVVAVPEGTARLKLNKIVVDRRGMRRACRNLLKGLDGSGCGKEREKAAKLRDIMNRVRRGRCDQETLRAILAIYCCVCPCTGDDGSNGKVPSIPPGLSICNERFFFLPADFDYTVDVGGYVGQFGPLPFEDPWWKVLLLILAVIFAIVAIIAELTGWGKSQEPLRIGTVGDFSTANVDAALVDLNDSRGFMQAVADAITDEPNQNPAVALDAVINIDPQVAPPFVGMQVIKSGARTGFTHGIITSITAGTNQCRGTWDDNTNTCTPDPNRPNLVMNGQIRIAQDPAFGEPTTDSGDSGSLWLSNEPGTLFQVVALTHSGTNTSDANPIQDVLNALNIRLNP
jgi:hypothetical protein